jgi:hypothetical protein
MPFMLTPELRSAPIACVCISGERGVLAVTRAGVIWYTAEMASVASLKVTFAEASAVRLFCRVALLAVLLVTRALALLRWSCEILPGPIPLIILTILAGIIPLRYRRS